MLTMLMGGFGMEPDSRSFCGESCTAAFLVIQHSWSFSTKGIEPWKKNLLYRFAACAVTFIAVHFAWVYFRSNSLESAHESCWQCSDEMASRFLLQSCLNSDSSMMCLLRLESRNNTRAELSSSIGCLDWNTAVIIWCSLTTQHLCKIMSPPGNIRKMGDPIDCGQDSARFFHFREPINVVVADYWRPIRLRFLSLAQCQSFCISSFSAEASIASW